MSTTTGPQCNRCGNCCRLPDAYDTFATDTDIERWRQNSRSDILQWVMPVSMGGGHFAYKIWVNPATGCGVSHCPWLQFLPGTGHLCRIYADRPQHCVDYPLSAEHARKTGCRAQGVRSILIRP